LQINVMEYLSLKFDLNIRENIRQKTPVNVLSDHDIKKIVRDFISLIKNGIWKA